MQGGLSWLQGSGRAAAGAPARLARWLQGSGALLAGAVQAQQSERLLWLPVGLMAGIALYFALAYEPARWTALAAAAVPAALLVPLGRRQGRLATGLRAACVAALCVGAGFALGQWRSHGVAAPVLAKRTAPLLLTGQLHAVEARGAGARLMLTNVAIEGLEPERTPRRVRVVSRRPQPGLLPGQWLELRAVLMPPPAPARPDGFDFTRMAWFMQLGAVGFSLGAARPLAVPEQARPATFAMRINALRQQLTERIRSGLPGPPGAVAAALLTGDRGAIPDHVVEDMRAAGLAHLLAISGLHIGLVAATIFFAVRLGLALVEPVALRFPIKKWAAATALCGAFVYLLISGASVPTQRAFLMAALALTAVLIDRNPISLRLVAFAAIVVLILQPESLLGASFQMSFAAVLALVAVYERAGPALARWRRHMSWRGRLLMYLVAVLLTTAVASTATGPFAAYHFHRVASYGLIANLLAVPVMALWIMPWAVAVLVSLPLGLETLPLWMMGQGIDLVVGSAARVAAWPGAVHLVPAFSVAALLLCAAGGIWLCLWRGWGRLAGLLPLLGALALAGGSAPPDVLVAADGKVLALRMDGQAYVAGSRSRRDVRWWLDSWGCGPARPAGRMGPARCAAMPSAAPPGCVAACWPSSGTAGPWTTTAAGRMW